MFIGFTAFSLILAGVLGALVGSFANVVIFRVPAGRSVVFPGSSCPNCGYRLQPWDLVPIFSWLALGRRCRKCRTPISARYPIIEGIMALGFVLLAWRFPPLLFNATVLPLLALYAMLLMMSMIDIDHYLLPDSLTLPATVVGIFGALLYSPFSNLPNLGEAVFGAAFAAGCITLINRVGSLALRRFQDTAERLFPVGMDQVNIAALAGALAGVWVGLALALASVILNVVTKRVWRIPEPILYGLWGLSLIILPWHPFISVQTGLLGSAAAAGAAAVLGALYWWLMELTGRVEAVSDASTSSEANADGISIKIDEAGSGDTITKATPTSVDQLTSAGQDAKDAPSSADSSGGSSLNVTADDEPIAMGFGDVKLAAVLGTFLGWQLVLVALFLSFIVGAVGGIISRLLSGAKIIPFGPYLALSGLLALFIGRPLMAWYLGLLGF
ncbi:MAG: prepilin peptidase [Deinococcota bacterium]